MCGYLCMSAVDHRHQKRASDPLNWSYRWLLCARWMLGMNINFLTMMSSRQPKDLLPLHSSVVCLFFLYHFFGPIHSKNDFKFMYFSSSNCFLFCFVFLFWLYF